MLNRLFYCLFGSYTRQRFLFLFFMSMLMSCGRINRLTEEDYKWMPYIGNETLVFRSNTGIEDTVFLLKKDTLLGYADPLSLNGVQYEVLSIFGKHTDPYSADGTQRYLENNLFQINKGRDKQTELDILFSAEDASFYRLSKIKIDSLDKQKPVAFQTKYGDYDDVYVINGEDYLGYGERSNFITKLYWSKSNGMIRFDKKDTVYWELAKKFVK
jgi:hypothetical protein